MAHRLRLPCRAFPCGRGWEVGGGRGPRELREIRDSPWLTRITLPFALFCPRVIATTALTWIVSSTRTMNTSLQTPPRGVDFFFEISPALPCNIFKLSHLRGSVWAKFCLSAQACLLLNLVCPLPADWEHEQEEQFIGCAGRSGGWLSYKGFSPSSPNYSSQTINYQTIRLQFQFLQGGKILEYWNWFCRHQFRIYNWI